MMVLHTYKVEFTPAKVVDAMMQMREPFTKDDVREFAQKKGVLKREEILAFTADDARVQIETKHGFLDQIPMIFSIVPVNEPNSGY